MRFCFIVTNLTGGGAEKAILKIASGLEDRGHRVDVVLLENTVEHRPAPGVALHVLSRRTRIKKGVLGKRLAALRLRRWAARAQRAGSFDLVVSTLPFADEVALRARLPRHWCRIANTLSAEVARLQVHSPHKARRRLVRYRRMYGTAKLIAVSDGVAADLRGALGLHSARIERIYNPFDFDSLRAAAAETAPVPTGPYVIHVGRFSAQKRHDILLDAWAEVKTSHTLVLLTSPDPRLDAMITARGLEARVRVAGFQANPYPWIAHAALLVLSSDHEGLPNVIIEALALGTPVVSTDCPSGPREILGATCPKCLVPPGDPAALANAIARALVHSMATAKVDLSVYNADVVTAAYERLAAETAGHV